MRDRRRFERPAARFASLLAAAAAIVVLAAPGFGQSGRRPAPRPAQGGTSDADVELRTQEVLLSVTVRDAEGHPVTNLTRDDFIVAEDRKRQELTSCQIASVPVSVVLVLDASTSVGSKLKDIREAAEAFVDTLGPEDRVSIVQFADKVELLLDWTSDHAEIRHALEWRYRGGESTAFWDGIYLAADEQLSKVDGRRAMIVLSDGVDTDSKLTEDEVRSELDRVGATVYVVSLTRAIIAQVKPYAGFGGVVTGTAPRARQAIQLLEASEDRLRGLADRYGGRMWAPDRLEDSKQAYEEVAKELKQQYVLTYVSQNETHDGRWRAIEIYLGRPGMVARTRKGYVAD
jgi:VWFA-related protein